MDSNDFNLKEYLQKEITESENVKFKKIEAFSLEYIPEKIYVREELRDVGKYLIQYYKHGIPENIIIYGLKGSGKTVSILHLLETLKPMVNINYSYINASRIATTYALYEKLAGIFNSGKSKVEIFEILKKKLGNRHIIVIDEVDHMEDYDFLYDLTRDTKFSIIILTTNLKWLKSIRPDIMSSFFPHEIYFGNYDIIEIFTILKYRAEEGLFNYDENIILELSKHIFEKFESDIRIGIRGLYYLALSNKWKEENIEDALLKSAQELEFKVLNSLTTRNLIVLYILLKTHNIKTAYEIIEKSFKNYKLLSFSRSTFYNTVKLLERMQLISVYQEKKNQPSEVNSLLLSGENIVKQILNEKLSVLYGIQFTIDDQKKF
ncbi:MAG: Cdc6/Cdc18 family protein [Thermoplasmata archaeon]